MKILILGGGSAGWMTAAYLSRNTDHNITLIENLNYPTIGVGESTIPSINDFIESVGITENDLVEHCSAIRKYTIQHNNWNGVDTWWHHFCFNENEHQEQLEWMQANSLPNKKWRHAYHLDATKLGLLLRDKVALPSGVTHILEDIVDVEMSYDNVGAVVGNKNKYTADLYIDCTGFKALLGNRVGIKSKNHPELTNNYALCGPGDFVEPLVNYTQTYAMDYGWRWRVCIANRTGNGYVFNRDLISIEDARKEFISKTPGLIADKIFEIPIRNSYNTEPWKKNVVSIGLSCGFLEPLEATGLFLIHGPLKLLVKLLNDSDGPKKYNSIWCKLYNHLADFLSLHFTTSCLDHTAYWKSISKISYITMPEKNQPLFDQYSYRQLANARGLSYS